MGVLGHTARTAESDHWHTRLLGRSRSWCLFLVALLSRALILIWQVWQHQGDWSLPWYALSADSEGYLAPIDSLLRGEEYAPDYRMPGYGMVYLMLRVMLPQEAALHGMVALQVIAGAATTVISAGIAYRLSRSESVFRLCYLLQLGSTFVAFFDRYLLTETFAAFASALGIHLYLRQGKSQGWLVLASGAAFTWLVFLKPVFITALPILAVALAFDGHGSDWRSRLMNLCIWAAPVSFAVCLWTARNAMVHHTFQPLVPALSPDLEKDVHAPLIKLMRATGGSYVWWDERAEIRWFLGRGSSGERACPLPWYASTRGCPIDSLNRIADLVRERERSGTMQPKQHVLAAISSACERCIRSMKEERPWQYHIVVPARLLRQFILHSGTSWLLGRPWNALRPAEKALKIASSGLYLLGIPCALLISPIAFLRLRGRFRAFVLLFLASVLVFPLIVRATEYRYLTTAYSLGLALTSWMLGDIHATWTRLSGRRRSSTAPEC